MLHYFKSKLRILPLLFLATGCSNDEDQILIENQNIPCTESTSLAFVEQDGLLIVEVENSKFEDTPWLKSQSLTDYSGNGYLTWNGDNLSNQPGTGTLTYTIRISTPGTYLFKWKSYITIGTNNTEHNDSWLRIPDASHFYGKKGNNGTIVYPKGTELPPIPESIGQTSTEPAGGGKDGWFKIYMNTASAWSWNTSTSDNDAHAIYTIFDTAGDYTIEISGRSTGHAIDKFVLFKENLTFNDATNDNVVGSEIICN